MITAKQIVEIYEAGVARGRSEAISQEWGSSSIGDHFEDLEIVLIWGDGILTSKEMDYDQKQETWEAFKKEAGI